MNKQMRLQLGLLLLFLALDLSVCKIQRSEAQFKEDITPIELRSHSKGFLSSIISFIRAMEEIREYKKLPNTPKNTETKEHLLNLNHSLNILVIKKDRLISSINDYINSPTEDNWDSVSSETENAYEQLDETGSLLGDEVREFELEEQNAFRNLIEAIGHSGELRGKKSPIIKRIGRLRHGPFYELDIGIEITLLKELRESLVEEIDRVEEASLALRNFIQKRFH